VNLRLIREPSTNNSTLGVLFVDGVFECFVIEDVIREQPGVPVDQWKVKGATAIPAGRYQVTRTRSPRFGKMLPLLLNVPGFDGIRFHAGNDSGDTEGCPLPGRGRAAGRVTESKLAFEQLDQKIRLALLRGQVWIDIENPPASLQ
jgi:hypothetical protein